MSKELIERLRSKAAKKGYGAYSDPLMTKAADCLEQLYGNSEQLRAQLKEAELAEGRAKTRAMRLEMELAASQANEVQLREALEKIKDLCCKLIDPVKFKVTEQVLSIPSDTTSLEAIVKKAGEVMRERCAKEVSETADMVGIIGYSDRECLQVAISALPGITLQNL